MEYDFMHNLFNFNVHQTQNKDTIQRDNKQDTYREERYIDNLTNKKLFDVNKEYPDISLINNIESESHSTNYIEKYLIDGGDPNKIFTIGLGFCEGDISILMYSVLYEKYSFVNLLIANGADVNYKSKCFNYKKGLSALNIAVTLKDKNNIIIALLKAGADPNNIIEDGYKITPLIDSIKYFTFDKLKLLLDYGADPNLLGPLLYAARIHPVHAKSVIKLLLLYGADIDVVTENGDGILYESLLEYMPNVMLYLLYNGADPWIENKQGENALDEHKYGSSSSSMKKNKQIMIKHIRTLHKTNVAYQMLNIIKGINEDQLQELNDDILKEIHEKLINKPYNPLITRKRINEDLEDIRISMFIDNINQYGSGKYNNKISNVKYTIEKY